MFPAGWKIGACVLAQIAVTSAQPSTATLWIPGPDPGITQARGDSWSASVNGSNSAATTYAVQLEGEPQTGFLTEGPATAVLTMPFAYDVDNFVTVIADCSLAGTASAVCFEYCMGDDMCSAGTITSTYLDIDQSYVPVVITAGEDQAPPIVSSGPSSNPVAFTTELVLPSIGASIASVPKASVSTEPTTEFASINHLNLSLADSKTSDSASQTKSATPTPSAAKSTSVSTARGPQVTGNVRLALGAVIALGIMG